MKQIERSLAFARDDAWAVVYHRPKISTPLTYVCSTSNSGESTTKSASLPIAISPLSDRPVLRAGLRDAIAIASGKGTSALRIIARTRSIKRDALPAKVPLSAREQAPF